MLIIPSLFSKRHNSSTGTVALNPGTTPAFTLTSGRNGLFLTPWENLDWCALDHKKILLLIKSTTEDWFMPVFIIVFTLTKDNNAAKLNSIRNLFLLECTVT